MKLSKYGMAKQRGFSIISGLIIAVVLFGALAFFLAGRGINSGLGATYATSSKVSGFLSQVGYIATGFDAVLLNGTAASAVTYDTAATTGVFNPTSGGVSPQALDPSLFLPAASLTAQQGFLIYRGNAVILDLVGTAAGDYTAVAAGLKLSSCQQINNTLHGTTTVPSLTTTTSAALTGATATVSNPVDTATATDLLAAAGASVPRRMNGCYATTDGTPVYAYIHTLLAQ